MEENPTSGAGYAPRASWLNRIGIEVYSDGYMTTYLRGRWRFVWYSPRDPDNWRIDNIFQDDTWQIGLGPAVFVYIRSEDF